MRAQKINISSLTPFFYILSVADYPAYYYDPYLSQTFTQYGVTAFELFY